jgi:hypothetical protein
VSIALIVAVLGVVISDTYRYAVAQQSLGSTTYDLATWAAQNSSSMSRDEVGREIAATAAAKGVRVYQYGQTENAVEVWTETDVKNTLVAGAIVNMLRGKSFSESWGSAFTIRDYREAGAQ